MTKAAAPRQPGVLKPGLFQGKAAVVSGAGTGIGRATVVRLIELGMSVTGIGRRKDPLAETADAVAGLSGRFTYHCCDVRDGDALEAVITQAGETHGIDLLVNNAGGQFFAPASEISRRGWDAVIDLNLTAVFAATIAAYPYLKASQGAVVNMSLSGVDRGSMGIAHSIAARSGVLGLTRSLALEWAGDGIRLNCLGPGTVATSGLSDEATEQLLDRLIAATPMKAETSPLEIAELIGFLASPAAQMMTGQLIQIDGGAHIGAGLHMIKPS